MEVTRIKESVYSADIRVLTNCSPKQFSAYCKKCFDAECLPPKQGHFVVFDNGSICVYLIWIENFYWRIYEYGILAHEVFHCVYRVLDDVGLSLTDSSDEAYACYFQFIFQEIISQLKNKLR